MNLEQGDYLEVNFKEIIRQLIQNHEIIWGVSASKMQTVKSREIPLILKTIKKSLFTEV